MKWPKSRFAQFQFCWSSSCLNGTTGGEVAGRALAVGAREAIQLDSIRLSANHKALECAKCTRRHSKLFSAALESVSKTRALDVAFPLAVRIPAEPFRLRRKFAAGDVSMSIGPQIN